MVNYTPLGGTGAGGASGSGTAGSNGLPTDPMSNVNPAMNASALIGNNVQLINMLDGQASMMGGNANGSGGAGAGAGGGAAGTEAGAGAGAGGMAMMGTLEQMAMADNNWLEGIPGGMFDWGAFLFFSSFLPSSSPMLLLLYTFEHRLTLGVCVQVNGTSSSPDWATFLAR